MLFFLLRSATIINTYLLNIILKIKRHFCDLCATCACVAHLCDSLVAFMCGAGVEVTTLNPFVLSSDSSASPPPPAHTSITSHHVTSSLERRHLRACCQWWAGSVRQRRRRIQLAAMCIRHQEYHVKVNAIHAWGKVPHYSYPCPFLRIPC
jgi:hypothetical protein